MTHTKSQTTETSVPYCYKPRGLTLYGQKP